MKCRACGNNEVFEGFWREEFSGEIRLSSQGEFIVSGGEFQKVDNKTIEAHRCGKCGSEDLDDQGLGLHHIGLTAEPN